MCCRAQQCCLSLSSFENALRRAQEDLSELEVELEAARAKVCVWCEKRWAFCFCLFFLLTCVLRCEVAFLKVMFRNASVQELADGYNAGADVVKEVVANLDSATPSGRGASEALVRVRKLFLRVAVKTHYPAHIVTCLGVRRKNGMQRGLRCHCRLQARRLGVEERALCLPREQRSRVPCQLGAASVEPASRLKRTRTVSLTSLSLLAEVSHHLFRKQKNHHRIVTPPGVCPCLPPGTKQPWEARCCPQVGLDLLKGG